jgi:hypothetical protein
MSDFRAGVRDLVAEILKQRLPDLKGGVFPARDWPLQEHQVPAVLVYGYEETKTGQGLSGDRSTFEVSCIMAVQVKTEAAGRHTGAVEQELERICQTVCLALLTSRALLDMETGRIERIDSVKTTLNIDAKTGEKALGQALIALDLRWREFYDLPPVDVDCEEPTLTFRIIPDPSATAP